MSEETELIKDRLDIAEVAGEYVQLKRAGRYFKARCPFHQERTPSFIVSPDRGTWHCFGACSEGGDIFSFVQKAEGLDFPAALKLLAERAGVELKVRSSALRQAQGKRERLFELLEITARFYHEILVHMRAGERARAYLAERGVRKRTLLAFQVGYAPKAWDTLQNYLRHKSFAPQEMVAAGVAGESEGGKLFDRFRGRIMFPICDTHGRVVAFGGRIAPWHESGEEGKYVNTPETELYQKRRVVYNLARAKRHLKAGAPCLVVEGYMDVVMVEQAGVPAVVGSSGTAFTEEQIAQLKRFTNVLHFAFDADAAGFKAAISATQAALLAGVRVATIVLPAGQDPADVAKASPALLERHLAEPRPLVDVLLGRLRAEGGAAAREEALQALLPLLAATANPVQLGEMVREVSAALSVPQSRVVALVERVPAAGAGVPAREEEEPGAVSTPQAAERYLLGLLMAQNGLRGLITSDMRDDHFTEGASRELYAAVRAVDAPALAQLTASELLARLPDRLVSYAEGVRVLAEERLAHAQATAAAEAQALTALLAARQVKQKLAALQEKLSSGNDTERRALLDEFRTLTAQLAHLHVQHS